MEESLPSEGQVQPPQLTENTDIKPPVVAEEKREKPRHFFAALFISFFGSVIFSLIGFLLIAKTNPDYPNVLTFLVFSWPIIIFGGYLFTLIYYFKKNNDIFWGLLVSFLAFLVLSVIIVKFY